MDIFAKIGREFFLSTIPQPTMGPTDVLRTHGTAQHAEYIRSQDSMPFPAAALSLFCIATALIFHNNLGDQMQLIAFMKNIALAGGFLFLVINGAKGYCLDKK